MLEHADKVPSMDEVAAELRQLIAGDISRQEASHWASPWITRYTEVQFDKNRGTDRKIKKTLDRRAGADSPSTDRESLYEQIDFARWLAELLA